MRNMWINKKQRNLPKKMKETKRSNPFPKNNVPRYRRLNEMGSKITMKNRYKWEYAENERERKHSVNSTMFKYIHNSRRCYNVTSVDWRLSNESVCATRAQASVYVCILLSFVPFMRRLLLRNHSFHLIFAFACVEPCHTHSIFPFQLNFGTFKWSSNRYIVYITFLGEPRRQWLHECVRLSWDENGICV